MRALESRYSGVFAELWQTTHTVMPGEIPGKSSNENWAVRRIYEKYAAPPPSRAVPLAEPAIRPYSSC